MPVKRHIDLSAQLDCAQRQHSHPQRRHSRAEWNRRSHAEQPDQRYLGLAQPRHTHGYRSRIGRPPWTASLLALLVAHLEPEWLPILASDLPHKPRLVEIHRQTLERYAVHAARGIPWDNAIRADEPS
jgi:hypothetical protein